MKPRIPWRGRRLVHLLPCLALLTILALQQTPALSVPFFADDYLFLDQVRHVDLGTALQRPDPLGNFYRPLSRQVYFWALSHLAGESAFVAHLINLLLIVAIVVMLYFLVARLAGPHSGLIAALPLAVHYALDVPARWGAGTQDLLAIAFALGAVHFVLSGRPWWGAVAYLCALLSKEVVLLLPAVALCLSWKPGSRLRDGLRALMPPSVAAAVWLIVWITHMSRNLSARTGWSSAGEGAVAAFAHFPLVLFGLEFGPHSALSIAALLVSVGVLVLALLTLAFVSRSAGRSEGIGSWGLRLPLWQIGSVWVLAGILPIAWAASLWSAYYYCFALCGLGVLLAGMASARLTPWLAALFICIAAGSLWARHSLSYGVGNSPWTWSSHISDAYIARSQRYVLGFSRSLRTALPTVPPRTTFFFGGVPGAIAWQITDGPYVRWAYRDSTLRSYYLSELTDDRLARGPVYLFLAEEDTLRNVSEDGPLIWGEAFRAALQEDLAVARGYLTYAAGLGHSHSLEIYLLAWVLEDSRDHAAARTALAMLDMPPPEGTGHPSSEVVRSGAIGAAEALHRAEKRVAEEPWSADAHGVLADLYIRNRVNAQRAMVEAYAARLLEPGNAWNWRRWAYTQAAWGEANGALRSIDHYRALSAGTPGDDPGLQRLEAALRRARKVVDANGEVKLNPSPF